MRRPSRWDDMDGVEQNEGEKEGESNVALTGVGAITFTGVVIDDSVVGERSTRSDTNAGESGSG